VSQLVNLWCLTSDDTLGELGESTNRCPVADGVLRSGSGNLDDNDSWVVWTTVVLAVAEVTDPCLERWRVVLVHLLAVGLDLGVAGDRGPFAGWGEEADVDVWVGLEVVGLAGLGVGVEDDVDTVALLVQLLAVFLGEISVDVCDVPWLRQPCSEIRACRCCLSLCS